MGDFKKYTLTAFAAALVLAFAGHAPACDRGTRAIIHDAIESCWADALTVDNIAEYSEWLRSEGYGHNDTWTAAYVQIMSNCVDVILNFEQHN